MLIARSFMWCWLTCALLIIQGSEGLRCHHCYPCKSNEAGESKVCEIDGYPKGEGYHACSFEMGSGGSRRKRCIWLRNDPDNPMDSNSGDRRRPMTCHLSPTDDVNQDCFCFTNNCNRGNLVPTVRHHHEVR